jgi:hypothetical protein
MIEVIFTRPDDDPEWERRIKVPPGAVPMPGNLVKFPDETGNMAQGTIYKVDETIWSVVPEFGISQVEVMLIDV